MTLANEERAGKQGEKREREGREEIEEREMRGDRWAPPPCGIYVSKITTKTTQWSNMKDYKSLVAKDS